MRPGRRYHQIEEEAPAVDQGSQLPHGRLQVGSTLLALLVLGQVQR
jgi:hypothetical protein